jgi:hypothetical protein
MTDAARAERLWLALAVATWWLLAVGGAAESTVAPETLGPVGPVRNLVSGGREGYIPQPLYLTEIDAWK